MQTRTRSPVRLLHTADLHIDEGQASITAMRAVIDIALAEQVDLVLIAGDTFDHDQVSDVAARSVVTELARLTQPLLVMTSRDDHVVEPENSERLMTGSGATDKQQIWLEDSFHVATLDNDLPVIIEESLAFIKAHS